VYWILTGNRGREIDWWRHFRAVTSYSASNHGTHANRELKVANSLEMVRDRWKMSTGCLKGVGAWLSNEIIFTARRRLCSCHIDLSRIIRKRWNIGDRYQQAVNRSFSKWSQIQLPVANRSTVEPYGFSVRNISLLASASVATNTGIATQKITNIDVKITSLNSILKTIKWNVKSCKYSILR
jgi:hypothetical protein